jgi:excinuclease UvrABC ATPase subunit
MKIQYLGITTNNVKDVDIEIEQGNVIFFSGPSGSGKSSIVVDTIHKISEDEFFQLCNLREDISAYAIRDYDNILPSPFLLIILSVFAVLENHL